MNHTVRLAIVIAVGLGLGAAWPAGSPPRADAGAGGPGHAHGDHEHPPVPAAYANAHVPLAVWTDPKMIARGREIYTAKCAVCHGEKGDGKGPGSLNLPLKPADLTNAKMVAEFGTQTPMKRPAQPEEIAPAFVFLASPQTSSYITGEILPIIGGYNGG